MDAKRGDPESPSAHHDPPRSALVRVVIETNDRGPWVEDAEWVLEYEDGSTERWPNDGIAAALPALQRLEGFDNQAVIAAMVCTDNASFVVWDANRASTKPS